MKLLLGPLLALAAGCSGFQQPCADQLQKLPVSGPSESTRCRFQMSIDSPRLAGEFDGVLVAKSDVVRAQLFGDLGPKILDLVARRDRIVGYSPQTREAVDCALPGEAEPHLLTFMGVSLIEEFLTPVTRSRVTGTRDEGEGTWFRMTPAVEGMSSRHFVGRNGIRRRFGWMYGLSWDEEWTGAGERRIRAPDLSIRIKVLERTNAPAAEAAAFEIKLPADVRIVAGSRK